MLASAPSLSRLAYGLLLLSPLCWAGEHLELQDIRQRSLHAEKSHRLQRRDHSVLDLKNSETFLWGAEGKSS